MSNSDSGRADTPTLDKTTSEIEALSFAIFALNTLRHPDASDPADLDRLDERTDDVITVLVRLREQKQRTQRLMELVTSDGPVPCLCGSCEPTEVDSSAAAEPAQTLLRLTEEQAAELEHTGSVKVRADDGAVIEVVAD